MVREEIRLTPLKKPAWEAIELPVYNKIRYVVVPFLSWLETSTILFAR